uniref:Uncharacterized protein n=1 Tax=Salix viminalis TaxID=40686 RepID=A0A6N2M3S1_SALVM
MNQEGSKQEEGSTAMDRNLSAFWIGLVGATITLSSYSQTFVSPTQCIAIGLFVLMFGLLVRRDKTSLNPSIFPVHLLSYLQKKFNILYQTTLTKMSAGAGTAVGDEGANITKSSNEEGERLKVEENVVSVLSRAQIIASTEEEIGSMTTHSFTLPISSKPMSVAFVRWRAMTFSNRIQKISRWIDLQDYAGSEVLGSTNNISFTKPDGHQGKDSAHKTICVADIGKL